MTKRTITTARLAAVLAVFFILGAGMALFIWKTLSDFLAGRPVDGGVYLLALAMLGVFVGFAWLLARYLLDLFPPD